ncbi:hypothetical protein SAY86_006379 [Trapa natans]|uniref:C2 domain-containing protein n=1 Tax=Trapa natans TaxID=22666 RepID=A0AAN7LD96_TRANT|nr:hypothetical protein SAY86_006379 [Trapa natans]
MARRARSHLTGTLSAGRRGRGSQAGGRKGYIKRKAACFSSIRFVSGSRLRQSSLSHQLPTMDSVLGLLRICVKRGVNLAVRDVRTSDPYVVVKLGNQKLKTRVIKKDVNPEWNDNLTLSIADPILPIKLTVYDHDTFTKDDKMGDAEFDIRPFIGALKMDLNGLPSSTIISRVLPSRQNCLSEESCITWVDGKVVQDLCLRLRNVECGEVEIQLQWINVPGSKGI